MLESITCQLRKILIGTVIFVTIVAGGTYYFQSSLVLVKHYDPYTHWTVVLFGLPVLAGIGHRFIKISYPVISILCGVMLSVIILYPQYKKLWAVPPTTTNIVIYVIIIFGIGYIATQPIRTTFLVAFRMGRYSLERFTPRKGEGAKSSRPARKSGSQPGTTQPLYGGQGYKLAMVELFVGVCSLGLSIFSVFFLGRS